MRSGNFGVPTTTEWLNEVLPPGCKIGVDPVRFHYFCWSFAQVLPTFHVGIHTSNIHILTFDGNSNVYDLSYFLLTTTLILVIFLSFIEPITVDSFGIFFLVFFYKFQKGFFRKIFKCRIKLAIHKPRMLASIKN